MMTTSPRFSGVISDLVDAAARAHELLAAVVPRQAEAHLGGSPAEEVGDGGVETRPCGQTVRK